MKIRNDHHVEILAEVKESNPYKIFRPDKMVSENEALTAMQNVQEECDEKYNVLNEAYQINKTSLNEAFEVILSKEATIATLKEKEILGDRKIVELEHQKVVQSKLIASLLEEVERLKNVPCDHTFIEKRVTYNSPLIGYKEIECTKCGFKKEIPF